MSDKTGMGNGKSMARQTGSVCSEKLHALMPCPFCGAESNICKTTEEELGAVIFMAGCPKCMIYSNGEMSREDAIRLWNTRV